MITEHEYVFTDLYDWLIATDPDTPALKQLWSGLADRFYYEFKNNLNPLHKIKNQEKGEEIWRKGVEYGIRIPSDKMEAGLSFIKLSKSPGKITPEAIKSYVYELTNKKN